MSLYICLHLLLCWIVCESFCRQFELPGNNDERIDRGRKEYQNLLDVAKSKYTSCWKTALINLDSNCRGIKDSEQRYLALQFANCHLEESGLQTYHCSKMNFKQCTRDMASNIIAFQTYTEFFTHISDICFYLQSDIWRENTEATISKLSKTSLESLEVLSKSAMQQQEVLLAQEQSLKNQKDMLTNEKLLKEALITSAESAKDVFKEVRDHANQQKTMFSETFDNIFQSVERLANLQKLLLGEFIGLQSIAFYFVSTIVCYLFTSTPRTASARLSLFFALSMLILSERLLVNWRVAKNSDLTAEDLHDRIWVLRKIFLLIATIILGIFMMRYKDLNKMNNALLQEIQAQILELRKLKEFQELDGLHKTRIDGKLDETLVNKHEEIEKVTKQLELSIQALVTSTPQKLDPADIFLLNDDNISFVNTRYENDGEINGCPGDRQVRKGRQRNNDISKMVDETSLNGSKYNLRSRRSRSFGQTFNQSNTIKESMDKSKMKNIQSKAKKKGRTKGMDSSSRGKNKPAFFSSDDDC